MEDVNHIQQMLHQKLHTLEQLWAQKQGTEIYHQLYDATTQISGQGTTQLFSGQSELLELVQSLLEHAETAKLELVSYSQASPEIALSWVNWHLQTQDGSTFSMKSLFVWKNLTQGWRIIADMYAEEALSV
ncbi:hypothetical protein ACX1NX_06865 [Acinetobacter sp. ANC 5383]